MWKENIVGAVMVCIMIHAAHISRFQTTCAMQTKRDKQKPKVKNSHS
jgi:hypothetical protein